MKKKAKPSSSRPAPKAAKAKSAGRRLGKVTAAQRAVRRPNRAPAPNATNTALTKTVADLAAIARELRQALEALREIIVAASASAQATAPMSEGDVTAVLITDEEA